MRAIHFSLAICTSWCFSSSITSVRLVGPAFQSGFASFVFFKAEKFLSMLHSMLMCVNVTEELVFMDLFRRSVPHGLAILMKNFPWWKLCNSTLDNLLFLVALHKELKDYIIIFFFIKTVWNEKPDPNSLAENQLALTDLNQITSCAKPLLKAWI